MKMNEEKERKINKCKTRMKKIMKIKSKTDLQDTEKRFKTKIQKIAKNQSFIGEEGGRTEELEEG